jgi:hypothetical protein
MGVAAVASLIGKVDVSVLVEQEVARRRRAITARVLDTQYVRVFSFYRSTTTPRP